MMCPEEALSGLETPAAERLAKGRNAHSGIALDIHPASHSRPKKEGASFEIEISIR